MISAIKNTIISRFHNCLFQRSVSVNITIQSFARCFSNTAASDKTDCFSIEELGTRHFLEIFPESENSSKFSAIIPEIQNIVKHGRRFPRSIKSEEIVQLCNLETRTQRKEYLAFLCQKENYRKKISEEKEKKRLEREQKRIPSPEHRTYGLGRNSLLISIRPRSVKQFYNKRLANAVLFGEKIVLDLSYEDFMTDKEKQYTASQLQFVYTTNRQSTNPYDIYFCNSPKTGNLAKYLHKNIPRFENSVLSVTGSSYLDKFPHHKLVYLSPHAEETLQEYDHDAIYIIGAFVDTVKKTKVSVNKANFDGIKSYSLPLDEHIMWAAGSKSLTINQVFEIMLVMKNTGNWKKAFQAVPQRKLRKMNEEKMAVEHLPEKIFVTNK